MLPDYRAYITKITDLKADIAKSLEFIEWTKHFSNDSTVFIKPNFTFPYYQEGITTNPEVLRILLGLLKDKVDKVIVGESDGGNRSFTADQGFKGHGMYEICEETGAELVNLSNIPAETVKETIGGKSVEVRLPSLLLHDVDCFVSVPVLKVHVMTTVTLSMKNLWGCYPDTMRCLHHKDLSRKLPLITKSLNPQIVLIDGTYALDGHGPMYGTPVETNMLLSANNPVVADSLGSAIMEVPVSRVEHITMAEKAGLGTTDLSKVTLNSDWKQLTRKFESEKTFLDNFAYVLFNSKTCAKIVMDSPLTPFIYGIGTKFRNADEQQVADQLTKGER
jgi:uncharacterized protein (DUF362 family)